MFKYIKSFFKALNANSHPGDIAHAVSLGLLLALVPKLNLLWVFLFFLTMFIRMNKGAFFLTLILLAFVVPFFDGLLDSLGYAVLTLSPLQSLFQKMYNTPFIGLTRFNNTIVTGALVAGLALYIPCYLLLVGLVTRYRNVLQPKIINSRIYKAILNLPLIKQIVNAPDIGGFNK